MLASYAALAHARATARDVLLRPRDHHPARTRNPLALFQRGSSANSIGLRAATGSAHPA